MQMVHVFASSPVAGTSSSAGNRSMCTEGGARGGGAGAVWSKTAICIILLIVFGSVAVGKRDGWDSDNRLPMCCWAVVGTDRGRIVASTTGSARSVETEISKTF